MSKRTDPTAELLDPATPIARVRALLKRPPPGLSSVALAEAALRQRSPHSWWAFARTAGSLPVGAVREVLERLRHEPPSLEAVFLLTAVDEAGDLEREWAQAVQALLDLNTSYAWGSRQKRTKLKALATSRFLPAVQAAVVAGSPTSDFLAVLAIDGHEASVDALLPHFELAATTKSSLLDRLERLETHAAKTKPMIALLERVRELLRERNDESPALEFARHLGFADVSVFEAHWGLSSDELNGNGVPRYQCHVQVDSTAERWCRVSISEVAVAGKERALRWAEPAGRHDVDDFGFGACHPIELPSWFKRAGRSLRVGWNVSLWNSNLRGKKRDQLLAWMRGEGSEAAVTRPSTKAKGRRLGRSGSR